jgi:hypothetical protein
MLCHLLVVLNGGLSLVFLFFYVKVVLLFLITDVLVAGFYNLNTQFPFPETNRLKGRVDYQRIFQKMVSSSSVFDFVTQACKQLQFSQWDIF